MFKLNLESNWSIVAFCAAITAFALGVAVGIEWVLYPAEFAINVFYEKVVIVGVIAIPVSLGVALILRRCMRLAKELTRLVNRDRLTDVATRDFFFAQFEMDPSAYGASLMIDIDHFKQVNDRYGHLAGDAVIAAVGKILGAQLREQDIVCRFGGEEFLVYLHHATQDASLRIAERMRSAINGTVVDADGVHIEVTVSVGGSMKAEREEIDDAIKRADLCLYEAKAAGRNRTVVDWRQEEDGPSRDLSHGRQSSHDSTDTPSSAA